VTANYAKYPSLVDRTVFITGGSEGIGSALVEQFARQGSRVAFVDLSVAGANDTIQRCEDAKVAHKPLFFEGDLRDIEALRFATERACSDLGGVSVLVNNAANDDRHDWRDMTPEYFDDRMHTNLRHYFFAIQALAPQMIDAGSGSIINIGSSSYMMKEDMFPGYAIAKSAVEGITRTMARTFGVHGIRVNTVLPGWVATERQLSKWWSPEGEAGTMRDQMLKRRILPEEFAQMVLFLAADDGAACTAQHFLVDSEAGGRHRDRNARPAEILRSWCGGGTTARTDSQSQASAEGHFAAASTLRLLRLLWKKNSLRVTVRVSLLQRMNVGRYRWIGPGTTKGDPLSVLPCADTNFVSFAVCENPKRPRSTIAHQPSTGRERSGNSGLGHVVGHRHVEMDAVAL
jgi:D-xylose 1-dehydrogenase